MKVVMSSLVFASCSVTTQSWTNVNMLSLVSASCIVTTHSWPILNFPLLVPISSWSQFQLVTCSQFQLVVRLYDLIVTVSLQPFCAQFCTAKTRHLRCCIYRGCGRLASRYQADAGKETAVQRCVSRGGYQRRRRRIDHAS